MKKFFIWLVIGLMLAVSGESRAEDPVYFPDLNLKAAVEAELGITDPTPTDMLSLTFLSATDSGITDLTGLEHATNLESLDVDRNLIGNCIPVSELINLTWLDLSYNQISDISALSGLTNLTNLYLSENQISNISAVSGLTKLWHLFLQDNQISDCNSVLELTELTWLSLGNNQISDCNVVSGLTKLARLELYGNQISDISEVSGLTTLTRLYLYDNQISDITAVLGLVNLTWLTLGNNQISDISALSEHTTLNVLTLYDNPLNTAAYCVYLPLIEANNSGLNSLIYDSNPNPIIRNCTTDLNSLEVFALHWMEVGCNEGNNWCGWADLDHRHSVDLYDFVELARYWVGGVSSYIEDFETGDFSKYNWEHSGNAYWIVSSDEVYQGSYSSQSGSISHNQQSVLEITPDIEISHISFYRSVSSESNFDHLRFYIDGQQKGLWTGEQDWELQTYAITPGQHTFKWAYTKDGSVSNGSDCAWIDEIIMLP